MYRILRSALLWDIVQCRVLILYWHFGTTIQSHLYFRKCCKMSVRNYRCTLLNVPERCGSHLHCITSLKSYLESWCFIFWLNWGTCKSENVILILLFSWHWSPSLIPWSPIWDWWWTEWQRDRFLKGTVVFLCLLSLCQWLILIYHLHYVVCNIYWQHHWISYKKLEKVLSEIVFMCDTCASVYILQQSPMTKDIMI
jgi:hypothetical protein